MNHSLSLFIALCAVVASTPAWAAAPSVVVETNVPYGNAANVRVREEDRLAEVRFTPDPHGGPECLWFCFRVRRTNPQDAPLGRVRFVLENPETMLGGQQAANFRPVFRAADGDWERAGAPELIELPDGRREAAWTLALEKPAVDFAFSYPYGRPELDRLIRETGEYWRMDTIGVSQGGRPLWRLSNDYGRPQGERPGLYLIARQHSAEVTGSWVLDGLLRRFAELGTNAPLVWAVPLSNIDGIEQGDYGKDNFPYDLNRAWGSPPMRHETLIFQQDLRRWTRRCRPIAGFDFHAPGAGENEGIYTFVQKAKRIPDLEQQAALWTRGLAEALGPNFAAVRFTRSGDYASRWNTPRFGGFCQEELGIPGLAFETPYSTIRQTVMTREKYQEAGRCIANGIIGRIKEDSGRDGAAK